jgi:tight adherence protein C
VLLVVLAGVCVVAALALVATELRPERRAARAGLARVAAYGGETAPRAERRFDPEPALRLAGRFAGGDVAGRLRAAGLAGRVSPELYVAGRIASAGCGVVLGVALGAAIAGVPAALLDAAVFGVVGAQGPEWILRARTRRRCDQIRAALPNTLDLLAVSVEAGLGLDAAIVKLTEVRRGPLADELGLMLGEIRVGESRQEALRRLAERVGIPELRAFARAVSRSEQLGLSVAATLRLQAGEGRLRRQAAAEERAGKAPVKMLVPTVLFIFPAMFVVVLGPAVLQITHLLK